MNTRSNALFLVLAGAMVPWSFCGLSRTAEPSPDITKETSCRDEVVAKVLIDPALDTEFFRTHKSSYPFNIIEHKDGHLEDTLGGTVNRKSVSKIEHTASCQSSHQGNHLMSFCDATLSAKGLQLTLTGGLPAYASSLALTISPDQKLHCSFEATYPMSIPGEKLTWNITKKSFKMKHEHPKIGERLWGWLSVEFEETCTIAGKVTRHQHRIEGFIKPIVQKSVPPS